MRKQFLMMLQNWKEIDLAQSPNFITMKALFEGFKTHFNEEDAAKITASIKIDVCQEFVDDAELLNETVQTYVKMVADMRELFSDLHPALFWGAMNSREMTLSYKV